MLKCFLLQREPSAHCSQSWSWQFSHCRSWVVCCARSHCSIFFLLYSPPFPTLLLHARTKPGSPMTAGGYPVPHRCVCATAEGSARGRKAGSELQSCALLLLLFPQGGILLAFGGAELRTGLLCCRQPRSITYASVEVLCVTWLKKLLRWLVMTEEMFW